MNSKGDVPEKGPHWRAPEQKALKKSVVKIKTFLSLNREEL